MKVYIDGDLSQGYEASDIDINQFAGPASDFIMTLGARGSTPFDGLLDDVRIYSRALTDDEVLKALEGGFETSSGPAPADGATDVPRDASLSWNAGDFAQTHDVYFGTVLDDVTNADRANPLDVLVSQGQDALSYEVGRLEFDQTYYWRVDEVNGAPDNTVFKGDVWSFTVEALAYPVAPVTVTATGISEEGAGPENLVNGSGLDADGLHSVESSDMWLAAPVEGEPLALECAFERVEKLHEMLVWNYNVAFELLLGFGVKGATIEYSADGVEWTVLGDFELAQATAAPAYAANTAIDFGGAAVKYVRLTVNSAYGAMGKFGLSEVRFLSIPVQADEPQPADGATDVAVAGAVLGWKAGREAATHDVYLGVDAEALPLVDSVAENIASPGAIDLGTTYYWRIDEVNEAEAISAWEGDLWSFTTEAYIVVEDFESYTDDIDAGEAIFLTWVDGYEASDNGSQVGYLESPFAETTIVHGGSQAMPLIYDNSGAAARSEAVRSFAPALDLSANGVQSLSLFVHGDEANVSGQLYLKINNTKVSYTYLVDVLQRRQWVPWTIDLAATGADLSNVTSLSLGIEGAGASGTVFVDDIRLYPQAAEVIEPVTPDDNDPNLAAYYAFEGNANDSRGNYPGTAEGAPEYTTGQVGQAINLDNSDDHVVHAFAEEQVWSAYSVSLWVKTDIFAQDQYSGLFNNNSASSDFQIDTDGADPGNYRYHGSNSVVMGPVSSEWVHLGVSCDGATTDLYYNGLYLTTRNIADTQFGQIAIGVNRGMTNRFGGTIDEVRLYNRALSYGEVAGLAGVTESIPVLAF